MAAEALQTALRALARRELTAAELSARLERAGFGADDREHVVAELQAAGLQDDARAAGERARVLAGRSWGDAAIAADLERRGVTAADIVAALALTGPELPRALTLAARERSHPRLRRTLFRKGFSEETIEAVLGTAVAEAP